MEYVAEEEEEEKGDYSNSENPPHRLTCSRHDLKNFRHAVLQLPRSNPLGISRTQRKI